MDISLVAKMKKYDEFISCYNEGDDKKVYKGKSLLFYSLSNKDVYKRQSVGCEGTKQLCGVEFT